MKLHLHGNYVMNPARKSPPRTSKRGVLVLPFLILALNLGNGHVRAATIDIYPGANIRNVVNNNPAGTTFVIHSGLYRLSLPIAAKNGDVFIGQLLTSGKPGVTLSGARLLTLTSTSPSSRIRYTSSYYYVTGQAQQGQVPTDSRPKCQLDYPGCIYPEDLYFDNVPLVHVTSLSEVGPGKWFFDYPNNIIYFYDNPVGHVVETSVSPRAFEWGPANNVTIKNFRVEKFAVPLGYGAIGVATPSTTSGANWVIQNNEIRLNHGEGVRINFGWQVLNNYVHHNGNIGIGGGLISTIPSRVLIQGNEMAYNNYAHVLYDYQTGGGKWCQTLGLVVRGNYIHNNDGTGIWLDVANYNALYDNNVIADNTDEGAWHEISYAATVRNNRLLRNGYPNLADRTWLYRANLLSSTSQYVEAYCNTVDISAQGGNGMNIISQFRKKNPDLISIGNYFHHNTVVFDGNSGVTGAAQDDPLTDPNFFQNNRFDYNAYYLPDLSRKAFAWKNQRNTFAQFQAFGQETHGSADTNYTGTVPTVTITSPKDRSTVSGVVDVKGTAQDNDLSKVVFYVDWSAKQTQYTSPFSFAWNTVGASNGRHIVTAMAYDKGGMRACYASALFVKN